MSFLASIPVALGFLLAAAHFFRAGSVPLVAASLLAPLLLLVPRPWAARAIQVALLLAAAEWFRSLASIASRRAAAGEPYLRMACILGGVALFTLLSAAAFHLPPMRRRFGL